MNGMHEMHEMNCLMECSLIQKTINFNQSLHSLREMGAIHALSDEMKPASGGTASKVNDL